MELDPVPVPCRRHAVLMRRGFKNYGDVCVLKGLNMMVRHGTSYGLLGASGSGKTTLLSCVVGRLSLDAGDVRVMGQAPGTPGSGIPGNRIGFMPQETALYLNFTIRDQMQYFGWIFRMDPIDVEQRTDYLMKLLNIPDAKTMINNLSGGQKRRVSFAVALLHDPEILVLDEPTVGMDPVLREIIWQHLLQLCNQKNKTLIFTTHYIDEAKQAHTIGLMRNGCLLEEDSPHNLLQKYSCDNLEDVFLHLSLRQESGETMGVSLTQHALSSSDAVRDEDVDNALEENDQHPDHKASKPKVFPRLISKGTMRALVYKNLVVGCRDWTHISFSFGLIIIAVSSVYFGLGSVPRDLGLAVVNHDAGASRYDCTGTPLEYGCSYTDLSCRFLAQLEGPIFRKDFYNNTDTAVAAIRKGKAWGSLYFSTDFTEALTDRVLNGTSVAVQRINSSNIYVRLDMSNYATGLLLRQEILAAFDRFSASMLTSCNYSSKLAQIPVRMNDPVFGIYQINFFTFAAAGTLIVMMFFFGVALTTWCVTNERKQGLVFRNFVAGVTTYEVLLSYVLSEFVMMCGQAVLLVTLALFVYNFQCVGSMVLAIGLIFVQGINGILLGLVISSVCDREETTSFLAIGSLVPLLLFCGIIWPIEGMSEPVRILSLLSPLTMPVRALRAVMVRGWTISHIEVYSAFIATFAWTVVFGAVCVLVFKFKKL